MAGLDYFSSVGGVTPGQVTPRMPEAPAVGGPPAMPFQKFLDTAVTALEDVSRMENQTNTMIDQYVKGQTTLQEVMAQTAKLNIAIQAAVTVTTQAVNAFKEITQMSV
jgi:flagellar hook-basal body complex protein FliE